MKTNRRGFTLLEMVVAITILAAIGAIIAGSIRLAAASMERGEAEVSRMARLKAGIEILERAIRSADATPIPTGDNTSAWFRGEATRLRFVSLAPVSPVPGQGLRLLCFSGAAEAGGEGLAVADASPFRAGGADAWEGTGKRRTLLPGAGALKFSYSPGPSPDGTWGWREDWDSREQGRLPGAVRVEFTARSKDGALRTSLVIPVFAGAGS